ncbi:MAG: tRNA guanosine(34) transglycosylase Tgt [Chrysiogenetes bacterium]|nr:tRNA guanosine(34) transglycosylase Tgt [Chrysiogenetes bacterium]
MSEPFFQISANDPGCRARAGTMQFSRGEVPTPWFTPVGTYATVKAMTPEELKDLGAAMILCNTYHLYLRPGMEIMRTVGGLHRFMNWDRPILTDSGGYQVFSLSEFRKITEEGVTFRSHLDGSKHLLTPESVIEIQRTLGSNIAMVLDECPPHDVDEAYMQRSMDRTTRWAERSLQNRQEAPERIFGIIQGGISPKMRTAHAAQIGALPFDGLAIGGLGVGEAGEAYSDVLAALGETLDSARPHYLMGLGRPQDILEAVTHGVDLFDCVVPTRNARNGQFFTREGPRHIKNAENAASTAPLEESCACYSCVNYSRAYVRHLYQAGEILSSRLLTTHNLHFYLNMMREVRAAIEAGRFLEYKSGFLEAYLGGPEH